MHRSLVSPVGTTGRHHTSCPSAGRVNGLVRTTTSGGPNWAANAHSLRIRETSAPAENQPGLPRGAPVSTPPPCNRLNLGLAQPQVVLQILDADVAIVPIRRHLAQNDLLLDRPSPRAHFIEGRQRHRSKRRRIDDSAGSSSGKWGRRPFAKVTVVAGTSAGRSACCATTAGLMTPARSTSNQAAGATARRLKKRRLDRILGIPITSLANSTAICLTDPIEPLAEPVACSPKPVALFPNCAHFFSARGPTSAP